MTTIQVGSIVAFHYNDVLQAGIVTAVTANSVSLISQSTLELNLPLNRFSLWTSQPLPYAEVASYSALADFLTEMETRMSELTDDELKSGILCTEQPTTWQEYATKTCAGYPVELFARYFYIRKHPELYIWKKDAIRIRTGTEREEYSTKLAVMHERASFLSSIAPLIDFSESRTKEFDLPISLRDRLVSDLRILLRGGDLPDLHRLLTQAEPGIPLSDKIQLLRIRLRDIEPLTDPILASSGLPVSFPLSLDTSLSLPDIELTPAELAFSIDELDGSDFDDALSYAETQDGHRFGIHISAVSAYIRMGSDLYSEAYRRISSMYLTNATIPLFPEALSHHDLSLIAGNKRVTLSLIIDTDRDYRVISHKFCLQPTKIKTNFSYREVDNHVMESPFKEIHRFTGLLNRERNLNSIPKQDRDFYYYLRSDKAKLIMRKVNPNSPARFMIEEMMVLYNRLFAEMAMKARLPMLYRNISKVVNDDDTESTAASQAYLSTEPQFHPGIGASAYVHASSPIRRFTDLVNQYQMLSLLSGVDPVFSEAALHDIIPSIEEVIRQQRDVISKSERYWFLRYLNQDHLNDPLFAEVIKHNKHGLVVELLPWQKRLILVGNGYAPAGKEIQIVLHKTDPLKGIAYGDIIC